MTRLECEARIVDLILQIREFYKEYNPRQNLNINISDTQIGAFNAYWKDGADEKAPIDVTYFSDGTTKTCGEYIRGLDEFKRLKEEYDE